jgi:hypothetical protein
MFYRTIGFMTLSILFLTLSGNLNTAESKTQTKTTAAQKKKPAKNEGFRSAKFGMKEKDVLRAIKKDFKISKDKVKQVSSSSEKTKSLFLDVPDLLEVGGNARIGYIFGYKSKKLMQINIIWGRGISKEVDGPGIVRVANLLRTHLMKKEYKKEGFVANQPLNDATTIVFRGKDQKNRMALLVLSAPKTGKGKEAKASPENISLKLSYMLNPEKPDVRTITIKDDDF